MTRPAGETSWRHRALLASLRVIELARIIQRVEFSTASTASATALVAAPPPASSTRRSSTSMPTLSQLLTQLQSYVWSLTQQNSSKKLVTAMAVLIGVLWMYRRSAAQ